MKLMSRSFAVAIVVLCAIFASAEPRPPLPPWPERALNAWRFNDAAEFGAARTAPLDFQNVFSVESWSGYSLAV